MANMADTNAARQDGKTFSRKDLSKDPTMMEDVPAPLASWTRYDYNTMNFKLPSDGRRSHRNASDVRKVVRRVTTDVHTGAVIEDVSMKELNRGI